jgi:ribonucleoside-diphosphate reductase beta chain
MLFNEQVARKPNLYPWTDDYIHAITSSPWTVNEFNFQSDFDQFKTELSDQERQVVVRTLSAIGQIEIAVKDFWANLGRNLRHPAIKDLGYVMAYTEVIHNQAYERLLEVLGLEDVFAENLKEDVVRNRVNYLRKHAQRVYEDDRKQYIYSIILFTLFVENVSLFSQFYTILWFNRWREGVRVLKDTAQQVQYTKNEETLHAQVGMKIINTLRQEYPELFDAELITRIQEECLEAYKAESKLIDWMIGDFSGQNISADILKTFIANRLQDSLEAIGISSPLNMPRIPETTWMDEEVFGTNKTDHFHKNSVDYSENDRAFDAKELF